MRSFALVIIGCLLAGGCSSTLQVKKANFEDPRTRVGLPYNLLFSQYEIEVSRQVAECGPEIKILTKAEIKSTTAAPDNDQSFVLDPQEFAGAFSVAEVKLDYRANGGPISLNATAEDRTAQVITNVASAAVKLVSIAAVAAGEGEPKACSQGTIDALKVVKESKGQVDAATKVVESRTAELKELQSKAAALSGNVDQRTKTALARAYDALVEALQELAEKRKPFDKAMKVLTYSETLRWPTSGGTGREIVSPPDLLFKLWGHIDDNPSKKAELSLHIALEPTTSLGRRTGADNTLSADEVKQGLGVPLRMPVPGRLTVCLSSYCTQSNRPIAETAGDVLQLGYVYYFPCTREAFSSVSCTFSTTESGQLKAAGYAQKAAPAEGASGALKELATAAGTAQETLSSAETKRLQAATAAAKAEKEYRDALAALQPNELQTLKTNTELLNARRAELEAEEALKAARLKATQ